MTLGNIYWDKIAREKYPHTNKCVQIILPCLCVWHHCKIETFHSSWATLLWLDKNLGWYKTNVVRNNSARKVCTQWRIQTPISRAGALGVSLQNGKMLLKACNDLQVPETRLNQGWGLRSGPMELEIERWNLRIIMHSNNKSSFYIKALRGKIWKTDMWAIYYATE